MQCALVRPHPLYAYLPPPTPTPSTPGPLTRRVPARRAHPGRRARPAARRRRMPQRRGPHEEPSQVPGGPRDTAWAGHVRVQQAQAAALVWDQGPLGDGHRARRHGRGSGRRVIRRRGLAHPPLESAVRRLLLVLRVGWVVVVGVVVVVVVLGAARGRRHARAGQRCAAGVLAALGAVGGVALGPAAVAGVAGAAAAPAMAQLLRAGAAGPAGGRLGAQGAVLAYRQRSGRGGVCVCVVVGGGSSCSPAGSGAGEGGAQGMRHALSRWYP